MSYLRFNMSAMNIFRSSKTSSDREGTCEMLHNENTYVPSPEHPIQLLAAAPGSGSGWTKLAIRYLTGILFALVFI